MRKPSHIVKIKKTENHAVLALDPRAYPLPAVYTTAYSMLADAFVILDTDSAKKTVVYLKSKTGHDPEPLAQKFLERLLTYGLQYFQEQKYGAKRQAILARALLTQSGDVK